MRARSNPSCAHMAGFHNQDPFLTPWQEPEQHKLIVGRLNYAGEDLNQPLRETHAEPNWNPSGGPFEPTYFPQTGSQRQNRIAKSMLRTSTAQAGSGKNELRLRRPQTAWKGEPNRNPMRARSNPSCAHMAGFQNQDSFLTPWQEPQQHKLIVGSMHHAGKDPSWPRRKTQEEPKKEPKGGAHMNPRIARKPAPKGRTELLNPW